MKSYLINSLLIVTLLAVAALVIDQATSIRTSMPPERSGEPDPARLRTGDTPFSRASNVPTYEERVERCIQ